MLRLREKTSWWARSSTRNYRPPISWKKRKQHLRLGHVAGNAGWRFWISERQQMPQHLAAFKLRRRQHRHIRYWIIWSSGKWGGQKQFYSWGGLGLPAGAARARRRLFISSGGNDHRAWGHRWKAAQFVRPVLMRRVPIQPETYLLVLPKNHYVVLGQLLRFYLDPGMRLSKVHCAIRFKSSPYVASYIANNTAKRQQYKHDDVKRLSTSSWTMRPMWRQSKTWRSELTFVCTMIWRRRGGLEKSCTV